MAGFAGQGGTLLPKTPDTTQHGSNWSGSNPAGDTLLTPYRPDKGPAQRAKSRFDEQRRLIGIVKHPPFRIRSRPKDRYPLALASRWPRTHPTHPTMQQQQSGARQHPGCIRQAGLYPESHVASYAAWQRSAQSLCNHLTQRPIQALAILFQHIRPAGSLGNINHAHQNAVAIFLWEA